MYSIVRQGKRRVQHRISLCDCHRLWNNRLLNNGCSFLVRTCHNGRDSQAGFCFDNPSLSRTFLRSGSWHWLAPSFTNISSRFNRGSQNINDRHQASQIAQLRSKHDLPSIG